MCQFTLNNNLSQFLCIYNYYFLPLGFVTIFQVVLITQQIEKFGLENGFELWDL